ncbi:MAG: gluconokinase [Chloroflexota bacterium]
MTILVLDLGSSSIRALLFGDDAELLAQSARPHHFASTPPGASTLDAAELQPNVEACIDEILHHPLAVNIRAVGMDTFVGNLLGVDGQGRALTPIYTYADTRSTEDVAALAPTIDLAAAHQRTGCVHHTAYHPARLRWLRRTDPTLFASVSQWIDVATYLYRQWFGDPVPCSYSVASWSGLLNRETLDWDDQWLTLLDLPKSALPTLTDYDAPCSGLLPAYAQRWSVLRDLPFFLAVGDGAAANVGSGCVGRGQVALSLGTTAALRAASDERLPPVPEGLWCYRITRNLHLIGGATTEGGSIFDWVAKTFALPDDAEQQLAGRTPDAHGLTFLPLLAGERSPGWAAHATGTLHGLRLSSTPLDVLQAALEAVALRLSLIAAQLDTGATPVIASGGALRASPAWQQMVANALNRPIKIAGEGEITARGTAVLALSALDGRDLASFPVKISSTVKPKAKGVELMRAGRERQQALYDSFYARSQE